MLCLDRVCVSDPRLPLGDRELAEIFTCLAGVFGLEEWEVGVRLVNDREMAELNTRFMGCLGPTNVLSFPAREGARLGDLALSPETVAREIFLYNQDARTYTIRLLAHGLLHLLGYDHGLEMETMTDLAITECGDCAPSPGPCSKSEGKRG